MRICSLPHVRATEDQSDQRGKPNSFRHTSASAATPWWISSWDRLAKQSRIRLRARSLFTDHSGPGCKVKVPTLVMCGRQDVTTPVAMTNELTRLISGAIERIIPTGHLGCFDDLAAFNKPIIEFLDALPR